MGKKSKLEELTRHHVIPKSRGGNNSKRNIAMVDGSKHRKYHELFDNKTPNEIAEYLNRYFWNNRYDISCMDYRLY